MCVIVMERKAKMPAMDNAFQKIMKIVLLTFRLFPNVQDNCSFEESLFALLTNKTNTNYRK